MKKLSALLVIVFISGGIAFAGPPVFVPSDPDSGPVGVPIDGGASLLLASGAGYGLRKLRKAKEAKKAADMLANR